MGLPGEESSWAIAFVSLLILSGIVRGVVWLIQSNNKKSDQEAGLMPESVESELATNLPEDFKTKWTDLALLLLVSLVCIQFLSVMAPIVGLILGIILLQRREVNVLKMWQFKTREIGTYILRGIDQYFIIFVPMMVLMVSSAIVFKVINGEAEPQPVITMFLEMEDVKQVIVLVVIAVIVAPLWEEVFFRGILYPMMRGLQGRVFALLASGVLFGLVHGHGPAFIPLTFLGMALAWLYERSGKLGYCIGLHASFNAATAIGLLLVKYAPNG